MTNTDLREMYVQLDGNYDRILRLLKNEETIRSFLEYFLEDRNFSDLERAMEKKDNKAAFAAAHALKGVALNMDFGFLAKSLIELTDALRYERKPNTDALYLQVRNDYFRTVEIIQGK